MMMAVTGGVLCGDHTFKIAKIPTIDSKPVFEAAYHLMNEFGQVLGFWFCHKSSIGELEPQLRAVSLSV